MPIAVLAAVLLLQRYHTAWAVNDVAGSLILFNDNGAWSWFEDERAIVDVTAGKILVSSVAHSSGSGGSARHGDVEVAALNLNGGAVTRFTLSDALQADDHDSAALYRRTDGRYLAVYTRHSNDPLSRYRISTNPGDISSWSAEQTFSNSGNTTYSNLHYLAGDNGGAGRLYNIARTSGLDPHVIVSNNEGQTWSAGGRLLDWPVPTGDPKFTGVDGGRPYLKYASNGLDEIHFIASDDHPRAYDNSIYHGVIRNGQVFNSFGAVVDNNVFDGTAHQPNDYSVVFDTDTSSLGHAWTTDLELDDQGRPYAAFTARANNTDNTDHRFLYARFNGTQWTVHQIAKAGGFLYSAEGDYTGLVALDPSDPNRLFISTDIDPRTDVAMAHYEIFEGQTTDGGANWTWQPITFNSTVDNLRPIVPKWDEDRTALLWMRGTYTTYTNYDLDVVGLTEIVPIRVLPLGDLDRDEDIDLDDYSMYLSGLFADLTGLTADEAYEKGDLNGDFVNNFIDFRIFRDAYDTENWAGAFAALRRVAPEPDALAMLLVGGVASLFARGTFDCRRPPISRTSVAHAASSTTND